MFHFASWRYIVTFLPLKALITIAFELNPNTTLDDAISFSSLLFLENLIFLFISFFNNNIFNFF